MTASPRRQRRRPARTQQQRRSERRHTPSAEPVDYSRDYAFVRSDLQRIAIFSGLLFVCMVAAFFVL